MSEEPIIMSAEDIRAAFAQSASQVATNNANEVQVLRNLSRALAALQQSGIGVAFEPAGWVGSESFASISGGSASFSGLLRIGYNVHILSLLKRKNGTESLVLSYYNKHLGPIDDRVWSYDIADKDCYADLQSRIIELAARNAFIADNDEAGAFATAHNTSHRAVIVKPAIVKHP